MATQTTYYEFNKPEGNNLVNPLVDTNPNWDIADTALHEINERSFANATETVALGVHAISRLNTYTKFLKWIATANFTAGETFTVDGNVVAASTPSGAALETGAYVSGAVVIACLNADDTAMTIFVSGTTVASDSQRLGGELPSYYATAAALGSAETDIDNIQALNGNTPIVGIGDGTLTGGLSAINTDLNLMNQLLWTNENPSQSFAAQTLILATNTYNLFLVIFRAKAENASYNLSAIVPRDLSFNLLGSVYSNSFTSRIVTINNSAVFGGGYSGNAQGDNNASIPVAIYGLM